MALKFKYFVIRSQFRDPQSYSWFIEDGPIMKKYECILITKTYIHTLMMYFNTKIPQAGNKYKR